MACQSARIFFKTAKMENQEQQNDWVFQTPTKPTTKPVPDAPRRPPRKLSRNPFDTAEEINRLQRQVRELQEENLALQQHRFNKPAN